MFFCNFSVSGSALADARVPTPLKDAVAFVLSVPMVCAYRWQERFLGAMKSVRRWLQHWSPDRIRAEEEGSYVWKFLFYFVALVQSPVAEARRVGLFSLEVSGAAAGWCLDERERGGGWK